MASPLHLLASAAAAATPGAAVPQTQQSAMSPSSPLKSFDTALPHTAPARGLLHRLAARELAPPRTHPSLVDRRFYTHIFPNRTSHSLEIPPGTMPRRFMPDGRHLICFADNLHGVRVYRFGMPYRTVKVPSEQPGMGECVAADASAGSSQHACQQAEHLSHSAGAQPASRSSTRMRPTTYGKQPLLDESATRISFNDVLHIKHDITVTSGHEMLCKDFCLVTSNHRYIILASAVTASTTNTNNGSTANAESDQDARRYPTSLDCIPRLDNITFWAIDIHTGMITDHITYRNDYMYLTNHSGVHMYDNMLGIVSVQNQCIYLVVVKECGKLVQVGCVGYHTREDDELVVETVRGAEKKFRERLFDDALRRTGWLASVLRRDEHSDDNENGNTSLDKGRSNHSALVGKDRRKRQRSWDDAASSSQLHARQAVAHNQTHEHGDSSQNNQNDLIQAESDESLRQSSSIAREMSRLHRRRTDPILSTALRRTQSQLPSSYLWERRFGSSSNSSVMPMHRSASVTRAGASTATENDNDANQPSTPSNPTWAPPRPRANRNQTTSSLPNWIRNWFANESPADGSMLRQVPSPARRQGASHNRSAIAGLFRGTTNAFFNLNDIHTRTRNESSASDDNELGSVHDDISSDVVPQESMAPMGGLKHRILAYLYRRALASGDPGTVQYFCTSYPYFSSLVMWRMQFLDRHNILIKFGPLECVTGRGSEPVSGHLAFFVVYSLQTTQVLGVFENSSEELFEMYAMSDFFHVSASASNRMRSHGGVCDSIPHMGSWVSNNLYARDSMVRHMVAVCQARNGGLAQAIRRTLSVLPTNAQSQSDSPYFDYSLFAFDDKVINGNDRVRPAPEFPFRFYSRETGRHKFSIDTRGAPFSGTQSSSSSSQTQQTTQQQQSQPSGGAPTRSSGHESKRYVLNVFHPTDPVVFTVEQVHGHVQAFNLHYADF